MRTAQSFYLNARGRTPRSCPLMGPQFYEIKGKLPGGYVPGPGCSLPPCKGSGLFRVRGAEGGPHFSASFATYGIQVAGRRWDLPKVANESLVAPRREPGDLSSPSMSLPAHTAWGPDRPRYQHRWRGELTPHPTRWDGPAQDHSLLLAMAGPRSDPDPACTLGSA